MPKKRTRVEKSHKTQFETMYTYAMLCGESVKVGRSYNVLQRLKQLQTSNPRPISLLGVLEGDHERAIHVHLKNSGVRRITGEWFEYNEETRAALVAKRIVGTAEGFAAWIPTQSFRDDAVGDFARDTQRDRAWPPSDLSKDGIAWHLRQKGARTEAMHAFQRAWKEWSAE